MGKYDWKITLKKVGVQAIIVFIAGLASVYGDNPYYLAIAPFLTGLINYFKHRKDWIVWRNSEPSFQTTPHTLEEDSPTYER